MWDFKIESPESCKHKTHNIKQGRCVVKKINIKMQVVAFWFLLQALKARAFSWVYTARDS